VKTIPKDLVRGVLERDGGFCLLALPGCLGEASVADHRAERGMGGSDVLNHGVALVAACGLCNGRKTHLGTIERYGLIQRGLIVPKAATNQQTLIRCAETPVEYLDGERHFLIDAHTTVNVLDAVRGRF
jgi:hypothetical protein